MTDQTNFAQSFMHMLKGNIGSGILAMPISMAHCGLVYGLLILTILCLVAGYCVHLLVRSSRQLEYKMGCKKMDYAELARGSFEAGPRCVRPWSSSIQKTTNGLLLVSQIGICCVYIVFVVEDVHIILKEFHNVHIPQIYLYFGFLPIALLLSYIRTLRRLAIASTTANVLQIIGLLIIIEYLSKEIPEQWDVVYFKPMSEIALGIGAIMFSFEGISVALPVYTRMSTPKSMSNFCGVINLTFIIIFLLNITVGLLGYIKFGEQSRGSVTLNLPREPIYDVVRALYTIAVALTYPLQLYVPAEITWKWFQNKLDITDKTPHRDAYEYFCRTILVLVTFIIALSVPKLNLMMDLCGSISGTALSIIIPPLIHLVTFWEDSSGASKVGLVLVDVVIITGGIIASISGTYFSLLGILQTFGGASEVEEP